MDRWLSWFAGPAGGPAVIARISNAGKSGYLNPAKPDMLNLFINALTTLLISPKKLQSFKTFRINKNPSLLLFSSLSLYKSLKWRSQRPPLLLSSRWSSPSLLPSLQLSLSLRRQAPLLDLVPSRRPSCQLALQPSRLLCSALLFGSKSLWWRFVQRYCFENFYSIIDDIGVYSGAIDPFLLCLCYHFAILFLIMIWLCFSDCSSPSSLTSLFYKSHDRNFARNLIIICEDKSDCYLD